MENKNAILEKLNVQNLSGKYCLVKDESSHDYCIPKEHKEIFYELIDLIYESDPESEDASKIFYKYFGDKMCNVNKLIFLKPKEED